MNVLVTGAQGFIGRYLVAEWLRQDPRAHVVGLGRSPRREDSFTHQVTSCGQRVAAPLTASLLAAEHDHRYRYLPLDLEDTVGLTALLRDTQPRAIVHLAASLRDEPPPNLVRSNVAAVVSLLESVVGSGIEPPRIVLGSSGSVYGNVAGRALPLHEDMACRPVDPYSASKRAAEDMARVLGEQHGLQIVQARIFNPVGPGQDERHLCGRLAQQVAAVARGGQPAEISVGPLHTTRDYIDVRDVASALVLLAGAPEVPEVVNVATGVETAGEEILERLVRSSGVTVDVHRRALPPRPNDMERHVADVGRLRALGWRPAHTLEDSLVSTLGYYRDELGTDGGPGADTSPTARSTVTLCPDRSVRCTVTVERGLLQHLPDLLATLAPDARLAVLSDERVLELHGDRLIGPLRNAGRDLSVVVVPEGEQSKSLAEFERVIGELQGLGIDRRALLINFGGGTITDLGGFVAASYLRGINYTNVPTTLLAQHDSGIGGKVAVNAGWAKNFVGAFHHPLAVLCDPAVLGTLDVRDLRCGVAESIKVALCGAPGLFELLESSVDQVLAADPVVIEDVVRRSATHKIDLLAPDPYEVDLRRVLNLGHTYGHALEVEMGYEDLRHGEAVAYGLVVATGVAERLGACAPEDARRIRELIERYGILPPIAPDSLRGAVKHIGSIRLVRGGRLNFVLPTSTQSCEIRPELPPDLLEVVVDDLAATRE